MAQIAEVLEIEETPEMKAAPLSEYFGSYLLPPLFAKRVLLSAVPLRKLCFNFHRLAGLHARRNRGKSPARSVGVVLPESEQTCVVAHHVDVAQQHWTVQRWQRRQVTSRFQWQQGKVVSSRFP
jgi:hypothetical protein